MTVNEFKLPDVGEGLTEAEIVTWMVEVGDTIKVNDIICEIETAKSLVELPSPYAGTVTGLLVPQGETVAVGTPIIAVSTDGGGGGAKAAAPEQAASSKAEPEIGTPAPDVAVEPGLVGGPAPGGGRTPTLVGYGPRTTEAKRRPRRGVSGAPSTTAGAVAQQELQAVFSPGTVAPEEPEPSESAVPATPVRQSGGDGGGEGDGARAGVRVLAKPPVRKLAKDLGIDLLEVTGTGPRGTITRADVESHAQGGPGQAAAVPEPLLGRVGERETRVPVKGVRKMTAQAMVASAFTAPHVTEWVTVDASRTMRMVARLRGSREFKDIRVSPLLVVARAVCLAVRRTPEVNASWDDASQEIVLKHHVNLGIAAATPRGLVVPNVKGADAMPAVELARALNRLTAIAREGKTQPADMSGGSFTITNVGVFGVDSGTPIINPGESAILCMGAIRKQPWVVGDKIRPRWVTTLALSFDHRIVDGEQGSRFLADVARIVEDPGTALLF